MTRLLHITDLHFGPPVLRDRVEALVEAVREAHPELIVVSGDLVQRASFPSQFLAARDFLRRLAAPVLCVPGNHEIALLNPVDRLLFPYQYYRRHIHFELEPEHRKAGVHVLGVNSTKPYLIHRGLTTGRQLRRLRHRIGASPGAHARIVATHHPLLRLPEVLSLPQIRSSRTLRGFADAGVDLVLSGHYHTWRVLRASDYCQGLSREVHVVLSGSATSRRSNRPHQGGNSFSLIEVAPDRYRIQAYHHELGRGFVPRTEVVLSRELPIPRGGQADAEPAA